MYPNGVKIPAEMMSDIGRVSGDADADRKYINDLFKVLFPENYFKKQIKKGLTCDGILSKIRESSKHETMKGNTD